MFSSGASAGAIVQGQQAYTTAGTYTWVVPAGVTSVSVVTVGAGSRGCMSGLPRGGGGGGALAYANNIAVTPGESISVRVAAGNTSGGTAESSRFRRGCTNLVAAGSGTYGGGGGAGGTVITGTGYSGGNGGNGSAAGYGTGGGGGTDILGILGQGSNGAGGTSNSSTGGAGGGGGSSGANGQAGQGNACRSINSTGGAYGGGGGGGCGNFYSGGCGAVRIIWPGTTRSFPSTNTGNL
ncbi:hypothetical protein EBZ39_17720 [bacterium]|nr:hypothetical protein [bacterium]